MTDVTEIIAYLAEVFPHAFAVSHANRRPLKIGIADDLLPLVPSQNRTYGMR
jgi:sRNA-binding protein